ncbi:hypothetical protein KC953_02905 [Candidatus Saccharibacteria bacterium]|nr:hypothetical protein [Candidatus Saccharibacteria bacterium]
MEFGERARQNERKEGVRGVEQVLLPPFGEQRKLTEELILSHESAILEDFAGFRRLADQRLVKNPEISTGGYEHPYPIGRCREINDYVFDSLASNINNPTLYGVRAIRKFMHAGGLVRKVYVIQNQRYFQNAIQIGTALLDVANDTFDRTKPAISFSETPEEGGYEMIRSVEQFAQMAEVYWGDRAYPNIYLPALAPRYPVLLRRSLSLKNPRQQFDRDGLFLDGAALALFNMNRLQITTDGWLFKLTRQFLFDSSYAGRRLPAEAYKALLDSPQLKALGKFSNNELFVSDDAERAREYLDANYFKDETVFASLPKRLSNIASVQKLFQGRPLVMFPSRAKDNEQE